MNTEIEISTDLPGDIATRLKYLGFTENDSANVPILHLIIDSKLDWIIDEFYDHLLQFDEAKSLIENEEKLTLLKQTQKAYLKSLGQNIESEEIYLYKRNIGKVHERVGLTQDWFIGAYTKIFELIVN